MITKRDAVKLARLAKLHKVNLDEIDNGIHLTIAFEEIGRLYVKLIKEGEEK